MIIISIISVTLVKQVWLYKHTGHRRAVLKQYHKVNESEKQKETEISYFSFNDYYHKKSEQKREGRE